MVRPLLWTELTNCDGSGRFLGPVDPGVERSPVMVLIGHPLFSQVNLWQKNIVVDPDSDPVKALFPIRLLQIRFRGSLTINQRFKKEFQKKFNNLQYFIVYYVFDIIFFSVTTKMSRRIRIQNLLAIRIRTSGLRIRGSESKRKVYGFTNWNNVNILGVTGEIFWRWGGEESILKN